MEAVVFLGKAGVGVGVAVAAAVGAAVVSADVPCLDAVAARPHAPVRPVLEAQAVGLAQGLQRHAAGGADAKGGKVLVGAANLQGQAVLCGDGPQARRQLPPPGGQDRAQPGHVHRQLAVHLHETEDAFIHEGGQLPGHGLEGLKMAGDGVFFREQHRVVAPGHPLPPHLGREVFQRLDARLDGGHPRLNVFAVGGDGVEKISGETAGDLVQPGQDGAVVLGAEHHAVHLVRGEFIAGDQMGIAGVAHQHIPLGKAAQQPVGVILHGVGAPAGLDDRGPRPLSPSLYARGRIFAKRRYNKEKLRRR